MKLKSVLVVTALLLASYTAYADVAIDLAAGKLTQSDGTTPIPFGSLIQLVVSTTDSTFTAPTPGSFTGGSADDVVVFSFTYDASNSVGSGTFLENIHFNLTNGVSTGDPMMLRWWPTLTTASVSPGAGTSFGQFRTDAVENGSTIGWNVPADASNNSLNFLTASAAVPGSEPDSAGAASFTTAVPEPSTMASTILGGAILGFVVRRRIRK